MEPVTALAIGGGIQTIGGLLGGSKAAKEQKKARKALEAALAQFNAVQLPNIESMKFTPEQLQYLGDYAPELEQAVSLGPSAMEDIALDPRLRSAQLAALDKLSQIGEADGITDADRAALEVARRKAAGQESAMQQQILQNMQQRGLSGSGAELIARLKGAQSAADRLSQEDLDIVQNAQQRALAALTQAGSLGGQIRSQEFGEQEAVARAKDIVNQFNTQQEMARQSRNVGAKNQAALRNLTTQQELEGRNVGIRNEGNLRNLNLAQQNFENQYRLAAGKAGMGAQMANQYNQQAATQAGLYGGIGQAVGGAISNYGLLSGYGQSSLPTNNLGDSGTALTAQPSPSRLIP